MGEAACCTLWGKQKTRPSCFACGTSISRGNTRHPLSAESGDARFRPDATARVPVRRVLARDEERKRRHRPSQRLLPHESTSGWALNARLGALSSPAGTSAYANRNRFKQIMQRQGGPLLLVAQRRRSKQSRPAPLSRPEREQSSHDRESAASIVERHSERARSVPSPAWNEQSR